MRIGVYPGTFDPITLGHMDIIRRGAKFVDRLIIGVTTNIAKSPLFDDDERIAMVKAEVAGIDGDIEVVGFNSLLMDFADAQGASIVVRGIRGVTDFEYEYQLTGMNRQLNARVETVFLMADVSLQPIASRSGQGNRDLRRRYPQICDAAGPRCRRRTHRRARAASGRALIPIIERSAFSR
jgi:pantetheine-phosphate adenylyltransferase